MTDYPRERKEQRHIWANKLVRLLQKCCAANSIGIEACWLVTCVALVEDAKHYSGPVTFWTGQLLPITGFQSWGRLDRARKKAVEAGWLHYRSGTNRQCGIYWSMIPDDVSKAFNDSPVDEVNHCIGDSSKVDHQNEAPNSDRNVIDAGSKRDDAVNLPSLLPVSIPDEEASVPASAAAKKTRTKANSVRPAYPEHFDAVWNAYPAIRRKNKKKAFDEYSAALKRVVEAQSCDKSTAADWLLQRVQEFAVSYYGQNYAPEPERWFRDDRFHDSPEAWQEFGQKAQSANSDFTNVRAIVKRIWSPDLKNHHEVEAAIGNAELYHAAHSTGLSKITDASDRDRAIQQAFSRNLEFIRSTRKGLT